MGQRAVDKNRDEGSSLHNGRWDEEIVVVTMAEGQVGIAYRRQMKLCGLGESMGGINN